ncbi:phasin family protein [Paucibacter sp. PLA-PC-4]|uniref:phasin family protein n=1 Tax=Paucibacter sp. PLA-PC-4 TaxID=2993655 RepID=UPI00224B0333|nr:phasin family protein [Paucibacter sp. PLA-PC-4]MCX2863439.1 phasin family protein [Paucibacter sp. PLA-PC-4]
MVKKLQKMAAKNKAGSNGAIPGIPAGLLDSQLAQSVKDSAQQIWAAGLGAFAKAQGEGGKVFEALVKEGLTLQKKTQSAAEEKLGAVTSKMSGMAGEVGAKAGQQWDKLESIFEERVASALKRLGVPTAKDIDALIARIDALSEATGAKPSARKAAAKPAAKAVAKPAPKAAPKAAAKTAAKKPVAKKAAGTKATPAPAPKPIPRKRAAKPAAAAQA